MKRSSALRQQSESSSPARMAMPAWITASMDTDVDTKMQEAADFDPFDLQYEYTTGFDIRDDYDDP